MRVRRGLGVLRIKLGSCYFVPFLQIPNDTSLFSALISPYIKVEIDAQFKNLFNYSNFKLIKNLF